MANKRKETVSVHTQKSIADGIYDLWLDSTLAQDAKAGQFVSVYPNDGAMLLPRPISICEADKENGRLRLVYRVAGGGTGEFSHYTSGQSVSILGTLGNGFPIEKAKGKKVFLIGGGIGIPPMLQLAKELAAADKTANPAAEETANRSADEVTSAAPDKTEQTKLQIILGYRDSRLFLSEELKRYGEVYIATEDGSAGSRGNVMDAIRDNQLAADIIYACGPMPMLRAVKTYAEQKQIDAYISLEERMACGVGACLGCVVKTRDIDSHSHVNNARICTDGPVYLAQEVEI